MFDDKIDAIAPMEAGLRRAQQQIDILRGEQLMWLQGLDAHRVAYRDGYRSLVDWVAARLDEKRTTARDLVFLAEQLSDYTIKLIRRGELSYTRTLAEVRLREAGASPTDIDNSKDLDLRGVERLTRQFHKISRNKERHNFDSQYLSFQQSLDGSHYQVAGRLSGFEGELCRKALERRADALLSSQDPHLEPGLRRALALTTICQDDLEGHLTPDTAAFADPGSGGGRREPIITVVADAQLAETSGNQQGVGILIGPRVGPDTVDLIECVGRHETIETNGQHIAHTSPPTRVIKAHLRRAVLARDGGCVIDGCESTYRLEAHHIIERSRGGADTADNLVTLCWWHHHVAVHRYGQRIDPDTPPTRRRLLPPKGWCWYRQPYGVEYRRPDSYQEFLDQYGPPPRNHQNAESPHPGG